jgi:hypothetical protein
MATVTGGGGLKAALEKIIKNVSKASSVEVGFAAGATYPDGTSVPLVAAIQEFGAPGKGIPPRPFFRNMVRSKSGAWPDQMLELLKANNYDTAKTMKQMGLIVQDQLQQSIIDMNAPALSEVTVMLRGMRRQKRFRDLPFHELIDTAIERVKAGKTNYGASTKPLVDTGVMLKSVTVRVNKGE